MLWWPFYSLCLLVQRDQGFLGQVHPLFSQFSSIVQSCLTLCDSMDCSTPTPRVYSNSCPLGWWWQPTILSSVIPFFSCPQPFPVSGSFPMSQFFASGSQSIGVSASTSVLPMNTKDWSPLGWTGWISLQSKGLSRVFSNTTVQKYQFLHTQLSFSELKDLPRVTQSVVYHARINTR